MHHDIADAIISEKWCLLLGSELEHSHTLHCLLIVHIIRLCRLGRKVHVQVSFCVVDDFAGESYGALGSEQVELEVHVGLLDQHNLGPFKKAQLDIALLLRRHHLLHLLLQLDQLLVHFIFRPLKLRKVMLVFACL